MAKNYYKILGLPENCSEIDIISSYRNLALKYHPRNDNSPDMRHLHEVSEAYEVLSDPKLRQVFDKFGEFGLKAGVLSPPDSFIGGYCYQGNALQIFEKFFGTLSPFFSEFSDNNSLRNYGVSLAQQRKQSVLDQSDAIFDFPCTLEQLYNGCKRQFIYERSLLNADGNSFRVEVCEKMVDIAKGTGESQMVFENEGNQYKAHFTSKLVLNVVQIPHSRFVRKGNDLVFVKKLPLSEALEALPIKITTLDSRIITVSFDEIISPQTRKVVENEGMPIINSESRGRLIIKFDIEFPKYLPQESKDILTEILS